MPGISIDTKPCFLAQTHFLCSHSALQRDFLKLGLAPADGRVPPVQVLFPFCLYIPETQESCFVVVCPFKCTCNTVIQILVAKNVGSLPKRTNMLWAESVTRDPQRAVKTRFTQRS